MSSFGWYRAPLARNLVIIFIKDDQAFEYFKIEHNAIKEKDLEERNLSKI